MSHKITFKYPSIFLQEGSIEDRATRSAFVNVARSLKTMHIDLGNAINHLFDTKQNITDPYSLPSYTVVGVPTAASYEGAMIYVTDETGGAVPAFSDGTDWRRVTDRVVIS